MKKEICHVCKKEKKPYTVITDNNILSIMQYQDAREDGPICERCDKYFAMTGEFKETTIKEMQIAEKSAWFANMVLKWWEKDRKMRAGEEDSKRYWDGTVNIAKWCREEFERGNLNTARQPSKSVKRGSFTTKQEEKDGKSR